MWIEWVPLNNQKDIHSLGVRVTSPTSCELPWHVLLSVINGVKSSSVADDLHGHRRGYWKAGRDESSEDQKGGCVGGCVSTCWVRTKTHGTQ